MTKLQEFRKSLGITQGQFAAELGVDQPTVCRWEKGARVPNLEAASSIIEWADRWARRRRVPVSKRLDYRDLLPQD